MEERSLRNGADFPPFRQTGTRGETSKRPRFTKYGQEPLILHYFRLDFGHFE
jgi:hypothetical protein